MLLTESLAEISHRHVFDGRYLRLCCDPSLCRSWSETENQPYEEVETKGRCTVGEGVAKDVSKVSVHLGNRELISPFECGLC